MKSWISYTMVIGASLFGVGLSVGISATLPQAAMIVGAILMVFAVCAAIEK